MATVLLCCHWKLWQQPSQPALLHPSPSTSAERNAYIFFGLYNSLWNACAFKYAHCRCNTHHYFFLPPFTLGGRPGVAKPMHVCCYLRQAATAALSSMCSFPRSSIPTPPFHSTSLLQLSFAVNLRLVFFVSVLETAKKALEITKMRWRAAAPSLAGS